MQKFLFLADKLVGDFAKRLLGRFRVKFKDELQGKTIELPFFATIYDSVKTILSFRNGLVRVPTRNIFQLPLALAGLWHEVGVALFFGWYTEEIAELTPETDRNAFLAALGDHFAAVIVYLYGFGGNYAFFLSMAHGFNEIYRDADETIRQYAYRQFLVRLYLVYELDWMRSALRENDRIRLQMLFQPRTLAKFLSTQLEAEVNAVATRYDSLAIPAPYWGVLHLDVTTADFTLFHRNLYLPFISEPALTDPSKLNVAPFEEGLLKNFGPDEDLNAWFAALAYYVQAADRADDIPYFEMMASLGKSAAIEYHRRQMTDRSNTTSAASA
ncbi:MAG TPA: hypothetical protein VGF28_05160 [Thermoanaerobaculia bacterium]